MARGGYFEHLTLSSVLLLHCYWSICFRIFMIVHLNVGYVMIMSKLT